MKVNDKGIEFCGEFRKYRNCTNKELIAHQRAIEEEQEKFKPLSDKATRLEDEVHMIDTQIQSIKDYCDAINSKDEPTDSELDKVAKYSMKIVELSDERMSLVYEARQLDEQHKKDIQQLEEYIIEKYGELAELQLEITKEEYVEKATNVDATIVRLLASIKKMFLLGASNKEVEKFIKNNVIHEAKAPFREDNRNR